MPLFQSINNRENTQIFIWKITEPEAFLRADIDLSQNSVNRLSIMSSELHRRGFLSIRHLLKHAGYRDLDLYYSEDGKPHLNDHKYISITHSFEFTAIIVSDVPIGIDIEKQRDKIKRIASKFIGYEEEFIASLEDPVKELTVVWGAKESMYKLYGHKGLGFKAHCLVEPFSMQSDQTLARIVFKDDHLNFDVFFKEVENFMLAYVIPSRNA
ncbi:4'-phosphopantetheinyl transferase superfamily protein [Nonlabens sp.]|uniref:4'-phosphopantetheinyl transferase family protein n=1 Tax=Nonlabens sp. TaxID=1888209 RepID=UPI001BCEDF5F|nr:4'-phosphopantetheinyl transferase superfamily protein [Nonlabens sp.]